MEKIKITKTQIWIIEALFEKMKQKDYRDITISEIVDKAQLGRRTFYRYFKSKDDVLDVSCNLLMDKFAETILKNNTINLSTISQSYFEFWENYIDFLLILNKAHLLYFVEERLELLIYRVAKLIGHIPENIDIKTNKVAQEYWYEYIFKIAGFWRLTLEWCKESPRKSPKEMSQIIVSIINNTEQ